jgi:hypothetical protein
MRIPETKRGILRCPFTQPSHLGLPPAARSLVGADRDGGTEVCPSPDDRRRADYFRLAAFFAGFFAAFFAGFFFAAFFIALAKVLLLSV